MCLFGKPVKWKKNNQTKIIKTKDYLKLKFLTSSDQLK